MAERDRGAERRETVKPPALFRETERETQDILAFQDGLSVRMELPVRAAFHPWPSYSNLCSPRPLTTPRLYPFHLGPQHLPASDTL